VWFEALFPHLANSGYQVTSPATSNYNCLAWAARDNNRWWEPDPAGIYFWPSDVTREWTLANVCFSVPSIGFEICQAPEFESGFEKIAIYCNDGEPTHAARQVREGCWTSKLGVDEDIEHTLIGLEGETYGRSRRSCVRHRPDGMQQTNRSLAYDKLR